MGIGGWHFSCPLVGEEPAMVVGALAAALSQANKPVDYFDLRFETRRVDETSLGGEILRAVLCRTRNVL